MEQNLKLATLEEKGISALNSVLEELVHSGEVKVSELNPSLSALLTDPANGGFPGRVFIGKNVGYRLAVAMPDFNDKDETQEVDVLELQDATGKLHGVTFNFYGRNGGLKAKIGGVSKSLYVLVAFKGEVESDVKNRNPWKDYIIMGMERLEIAQKAMAAIEKAVGKKSFADGPKLQPAAARA